jgi:hypothetical protein
LSANQLVQTFSRCSLTPDQKFEVDKKQSQMTHESFISGIGHNNLGLGSEFDIEISKLFAMPLCHSVRDHKVARS